MTRFSHAGGAVPTTLGTPLTELGLTDFTIDSAAGWPDGSDGPFFVVVDRGQNAEEKVLVGTRSGTTLTPLQRGADGTTPFSHAQGATIEHVFSALEADEANAHIHDTSGVHGVQSGKIIATTDVVDDKIATAQPQSYEEQEAPVVNPADPTLATPIHGLPYPDSPDPLLVRRAIAVLAQALDTTIPVILSGTTAPPDPTGLPDGSIYLRRDT